MDLMERERKDPNWRDRELKKLTEPLQIEAGVAEEMLKASFQMEFLEILDTHSAEYNEGFINGWNRHIDMKGELGAIARKLVSGAHYICNEWLEKANAKVARHIT